MATSCTAKRPTWAVSDRETGRIGWNQRWKFGLTGNGEAVGAANPWSYPLLSPPPVAVLWRALALLPGDVSMYLWWFAGAGASLLLGLALIVRSRTMTLPFVLLLIPSLSYTAWSGNLNALLIPAGALVWLASARHRPVAAGLLVALSGLLKLTPGLFAWWFVVRGDRRALGACLGGAAVGLALSVLGAGLQSHLQYVAVAREAGSIQLTPLSLVSVARALGAPEWIALAAPYLAAATAGFAAWLLRRSARWSFAACALGVVLGTPTLQFEDLAWGLVALVPWATERSLAWHARRSGVPLIEASMRQNGGSWRRRRGQLPR